MFDIRHDVERYAKTQVSNLFFNFRTALRQDIAVAIYLCFAGLEEKQFVMGNYVVKTHFFSVYGHGLSMLTLRRLMSYIYGAPILDVSRSHTTTQHIR